MTTTLTIPNGKPRLPSWNTFYKSPHYSARVKLKNTWRGIMETILESQYHVLYSVPVDIRIDAYYKGRVPDSDNVCAKLIIDGLIGKVIEDDDRRYVRSVTTCAHHDKDNPRVIVQITLADVNTESLPGVQESIP